MNNVALEEKRCQLVFLHLPLVDRRHGLIAAAVIVAAVVVVVGFFHFRRFHIVRRHRGQAQSESEYSQPILPTCVFTWPITSYSLNHMIHAHSHSHKLAFSYQLCFALCVFASNAHCDGLVEPQ